MGDVGVGVTDQASGAGVVDVRARSRSIGGNTYAEQYVIPINERVASYKGRASTFRIPGVASANHNLFTIWNTSGSAVIVALKYLSFAMEDTGALLTQAPIWRGSKPTGLPSGGTSMTKVPDDSSLTSAANVELRGAASADGTGTTITSTAGNAAWGGFKMRVATQVGQLIFPEIPVLPPFAPDDPMYLRAAEGYMLQMVNAAVTTAHYIVNVAWEEFTLP